MLRSRDNNIKTIMLEARDKYIDLLTKFEEHIEENIQSLELAVQEALKENLSSLRDLYENAIMKDDVLLDDFSIHATKIINACNKLYQTSNAEIQEEFKKNTDQFLAYQKEYQEAENAFKSYKINRRKRKLNIAEHRELTADERSLIFSKIKEKIDGNSALKAQNKFYVKIKKDGAIDVSTDHIETDEDSRIFSVKQGKDGGLHATYELLGAGGFGRVKVSQNLSTAEITVDKIFTGKNIEYSKREVKRLMETTTEKDRDVLGFARVDLLEKTDSIDQIVKFHLAMNKFPGAALDKINQEYAEKGRKFDRAAFFSLAIGTCAEIQKMHDINLLHRDVKPENILYDPETGQVIIIDFDLVAKMKSSNSGDGKSSFEGLGCGTVGFLAPEIKLRKDMKFTIGVDIYALGCTLEEILKVSDLNGDDLIRINNMIGAMKAFRIEDRGDVRKYLEKIYTIYSADDTISNKHAPEKTKVQIQYQARKIIEFLQEKKKDSSTIDEDKLHKLILKIQVIASGNISDPVICDFVNNNYSKIETGQQEEVLTTALALQSSLTTVPASAIPADPVVSVADFVQSQAPVLVAPIVAPRLPSAVKLSDNPLLKWRQNKR